MASRWCVFDGTDDWLALTSAISFAASADLTAVVVYQSAGDNCLVGATTANNQILRVGETALNKLSFWDGATGGASSTLSVARTAWNIVLVQRSATFISFYDTSGFLNNAGVVAGAVKVESIGTLGFAVGVIPPTAILPRCWFTTMPFLAVILVT